MSVFLAIDASVLDRIELLSIYYGYFRISSMSNPQEVGSHLNS